jgi:uncharacterized protein (TIGR03382 family)
MVHGHARVVPGEASFGAFVALQSDAGEVFDVQGTEGSTLSLAVSTAAAEGDEICVLARQRDLVGGWAESDPSCAVPDVVESPGICGTAPGTGGASAIVLAALAMGRRRR